MTLRTGLQLSAVASLAVVTVVLVVLATTRTLASPVPDGSSGAAPGDGSGGVSAGGGPDIVVSVLGDDHVLREGSWFYRAVPAEKGGPIERGVVLAEPDARADDLRDSLGQVAPGDVVLVAAGSVDVRLGERAQPIFRDVRGLVRDLRDREAVPVLTLLPPADERGFRTKVVNRRLRDYARRGRVALVDIHTPVATPSGQWLRRFTDDGEYANPAGSARQAEAVTSRLSWLVASAA